MSSEDATKQMVMFAEMLAARALWLAAKLPDGITGREALILFAEALRETNAEFLPKDGQAG